MRTLRLSMLWSATVISIGIVMAACPAWASADSPTESSTAPPIVELPFPTTPLPPASAIAVPTSAKFEHAVKAGTTVQTPCFSVIAPIDSIAVSAGCSLELATTSFGEMDDPYFEAFMSVSAATTSDAMLASFLGNVKAGNAREKLHQGYDSDDGPYLGTRNVTMFGQNAALVAWGSIETGPNINECVYPNRPPNCSHTRALEAVQVFEAFDPGRYLSNGKGLNQLLVFGHSIGYLPRAFAATLQSMSMK